MTRILSSGFEGCTKLLTISIPDSITIIESYAFGECGVLSDVSIPNSVTRIEESAFIGCRALLEINIPQSVTFIGEKAFYQTSLTSVVFENPTYRNAVIGVSHEGRVIYSERIIIEDMMFDEGMEYEEAIEHFNYNLLRSLPYMGEMAPIIQQDIVI